MIAGINSLYNDAKKGITKPISEELPTKVDEFSNNLFNQTLKKVSPEESAEERRKQETVLKTINEMYRTWLEEFEYSQIKNLNGGNEPDRNGQDISEKNEENVLPKEHSATLIYTFGSFRLGVHERGADIDTLLVGPSIVSHDIFFDKLCDGVISKAKGVSNYTTVRNSFVPICKFVFDGVHIDLIYAQSALRVLDESFDIHNDEVLLGVSPQTIRSLNGVRVTDKLLDLVPDTSVFKKCVRFIKIWARRRGVYGNALGYLGGVSYSIMVGRICQLYPKGNCSVIIRQFFAIFDSWHWPNPVCLNKIKSDGPGDHPVWSREANLYERMPVITPSYPAQNSTYNVTFSNFICIRKELERAKEIVLGLNKNTKHIYEELLKENSFFDNHKNFFQICGFCNEDDDSEVWFGWVESRIRKFVTIIEEHLCFRLYPYPKAFYHSLETEGKKAMSYFVGVKVVVSRSNEMLRRGIKQRVNLSPTVNLFMSQIREFKLRKGGMDIKVNYVRRSKLPSFVYGEESEAIKRKRKAEAAK